MKIVQSSKSVNKFNKAKFDIARINSAKLRKINLNYYKLDFLKSVSFDI